MGFKYAVLASPNEPDTVLEAFKSAVAPATTEVLGSSSVSLPDKLQSGSFTLAQIADCVAIAFPYELLCSANYDLSGMASQLPGFFIAVGQEDTAGETWFQRFEDGVLVAAYHCGDGVVAKLVGDQSHPEPSDWTESDVFELLPESLRLGEDGSVLLVGQNFRYDRGGRQNEKRSESPWWKFWLWPAVRF